jgi:S1-C subfamily serine protease
MDSLSSLSETLAALAAASASRLFHVPSALGGRTALGFDGKNLLVPAIQAEEGESLELLAPGGAKVGAKVVGFDPALGLAVLSLDLPLPATAWTIDEGLPPLGSLVLAAAWPSPAGPEARLDAVRFSGGQGDEAYIQTDGLPFPGFAGGALVTPAGRLGGFILANRQGNRGYALPAARAKALSASIAAVGFPGKAWLGVSTIPIEPPSSLAMNEGEGSRSVLLVAGIEGASPAEKAGLMVGDLILAVGGVKLADPDDLRAAMARARPGESLALSIFRAGSRLEITALPIKAPSAAEGHEAPGGGWQGGHHARHHGWRGSDCCQGR